MAAETDVTVFPISSIEVRSSRNNIGRRLEKGAVEELTLDKPRSERIDVRLILVQRSVN